MTAEDVLSRRSKLGLHLTPATVAALGAWFSDALANRKVAVQ